MGATRAVLKKLPMLMAERAAWARWYACRNPDKVQVDSEMLPWVWCEEESVWMSFDGNYSQSSPEEKIAKEMAYQERLREQESNALKKAESILAYSMIREKVLERDNYTCQRCGCVKTTKLHCHHIVKRKQGGTDTLDNLLTLCPKCHAVADRSEYDPEWERPQKLDWYGR